MRELLLITGLNRQKPGPAGKDYGLCVESEATVLKSKKNIGLLCAVLVMVAAIIVIIAARDEDAASDDFRHLEERYGAHLGVYAINVDTGNEVRFNEGQRFAYASTFKSILSAAVLDEYSLEGLGEKVHVTEQEILDYAPVLQGYVGSEVALGEVIKAAVGESDNTAANILFDKLGGPSGVQEILRNLQDSTTSVDRIEPELNEAAPGDNRDTTTPEQMVRLLRAYFDNGKLGSEERELLLNWMRESKTGDTLIKAGVPSEWSASDKSGAGKYGSRGDVAVVETDEGTVYMAIYSRKGEESAEYDDQLIADAARVVARNIN